MRSLLAAASLLALSLAAPAAHAQTAATDAKDPYIWLEDATGPKAMAWVNDHNAKAVSVLESNPRYAQNYQEALTIAEAKDRIPAGSFVHGSIYNFWQDADHVRGIWRKRPWPATRPPHPTGPPSST